METIFYTYGEYVLMMVAFCLLAGPVVHHLVWGWRSKREEVLASFLESGIQSYFSLFFPAQFGASEDPDSEFLDFYDRRFGRKRFIISGVLLALVSMFMLYYASGAVFYLLRQEVNPGFKIPPLALAAFSWGTSGGRIGAGT